MRTKRKVPVPLPFFGMILIAPTSEASIAKITKAGLKIRLETRVMVGTEGCGFAGTQGLAFIGIGASYRPSRSTTSSHFSRTDKPRMTRTIGLIAVPGTSPSYLSYITHRHARVTGGSRSRYSHVRCAVTLRPVSSPPFSPLPSPTVLRCFSFFGASDDHHLLSVRYRNQATPPNRSEATGIKCYALSELKPK